VLQLVALRVDHESAKVKGELADARKATDQAIRKAYDVLNALAVLAPSSDLSSPSSASRTAPNSTTSAAVRRPAVARSPHPRPTAAHPTILATAALTAALTTALTAMTMAEIHPHRHRLPHRRPIPAVTAIVKAPAATSKRRFRQNMKKSPHFV